MKIKITSDRHPWIDGVRYEIGDEYSGTDIDAAQTLVEMGMAEVVEEQPEAQPEAPVEEPVEAPIEETVEEVVEEAVEEPVEEPEAPADHNCKKAC